MGVSAAWHGKGLGELLLMHALERSWIGSQQVASWAMVVDAKPGAHAFYVKYGFIPLPSLSDRLFLPMTVIEELFDGGVNVR